MTFFTIFSLGIAFQVEGMYLREKIKQGKRTTNTLKELLFWMFRANDLKTQPGKQRIYKLKD